MNATGPNAGAAARWTAAEISTAAQLACLLEASAPKPGQVSPARAFRDMAFEDFLASAAAIGSPLLQAGAHPLGTTIREAVAATERWTRTNTNLGMVLLLAPLARAASRVAGDAGAGNARAALRDHVARVLDETTVADATDVFAAIRRAAPGGLGKAPEQDVTGDPTLPLKAIMALASERDDVAREYATGFETTFDLAVPALDRARQAQLGWNEAIVETFLTVLAARHDTHVRRRGGEALAADVSRRAIEALGAGGVRSDRGRRTIEQMDAALRTADNLANPGTTADLTTAAIFVVLLTGGWRDFADGTAQARSAWTRQREFSEDRDATTR
jgi:triphosphoribosyl-dephospho-CoA synthase